MKVGIFLAMVATSLCLPVFAASGDLCTEALPRIQLSVPTAQVFASSKALVPLAFTQNSQSRVVRFADLLPEVRADFSGLTYLIRGHGRALTKVFFVVDSDLLTANNTDLMNLLKLEKTYDNKRTEFIIIRKKVTSEFIAAVNKLNLPAEPFERMIQRFQYLTTPSDNDVPEELRDIQGTLTLYLKMNKWILDIEEAKKRNITNNQIMVDVRKQQLRITEKLSPGWTLLKAGCHNSESRYQVYENLNLKGTYLVLEKIVAKSNRVQ